MVIGRATRSNVLESCKNLAESLGVGPQGQDIIIIKKQISEEEFTKQVVEIMRDKGKILDSNDIDFLLGKYIECKDLTLWEKIKDFFIRLIRDLKVSVGDLGQIKTSEQYIAVLDDTLGQVLGNLLLPLVMQVCLIVVVQVATYLIGTFIAMALGWFLAMLLFPFLLAVAITVDIALWVTFFKNVRKSRLMMLDTCYQIDGTIKDMELRKEDPAKIELLKQVKARIMKHALITHKGLEKYKMKQLSISQSAIDSIALVRRIDPDKAQKRYVELLCETHLPIIEDYFDFDSDSGEFNPLSDAEDVR